MWVTADVYYTGTVTCNSTIYTDVGVVGDCIIWYYPYPLLYIFLVEIIIFTIILMYFINIIVG